VSDIREAAVAGSFYPSSPQHLKSDIVAFLDSISLVDPPEDLIALIVPHADYVYSGRVAAHAYRLLKSRFLDTIILLGPNHQALGFKGISVYSKGAFKTPLGLMKIDEAFSEQILSLDPEAKFNREAHAREHSLEVQIPFLQILAPQAKIVPIVMADDRKATCKRLARALVQAIRSRKDEKILVIASSDLSHYHPYDEAVKLDETVIKNIEALDHEQLYHDVVDKKSAELCGFGPVLTALMVSCGLKANWVKTLGYANSGDVTKDRKNVVGYVSVGIFKKALKEEKIFREMEEACLQEEEIICGLA
jgi:AmmeMemoRadiSam system protein B